MLHRKYFIVFLFFLNAFPSLHSGSKNKEAMKFSAPSLTSESSPSISQEEFKNLLNNYTQSLQLLRQLEEEIDLERLANIRWRYTKGISIIKLLYEKILSLEHHFTGLQTHQNIADLSNPHSYPEFQKNRALVQKKLQKKFQLNVPSFLDGNPYIATTYSLVTSLLGAGDPVQKQADFEKIACILDFTLRMNTDLRVINNETVFLGETIAQLKIHCENLFQEYSKPIAYYTSLKQCRENDDWDQINDRVKQLMAELETNRSSSGRQINWKKQVDDLEFATKRVVDFISEYSQFINLGIQYYQKFDHIISSYENELVCREQMPRQFINLRIDVESTLNKFSNTYTLPELKGSQLKDLLYGKY